MSGGLMFLFAGVDGWVLARGFRRRGWWSVLGFGVAAAVVVLLTLVAVAAGAFAGHWIGWRSALGVVVCQGVMAGLISIAMRCREPRPESTGSGVAVPVAVLPGGGLGLVGRLAPFVVAATLVVAGAAVLLQLLRAPHGGYDAWWMWNTKAAVLAADPGSWPDLVTALREQGHPDYPLLLPLLVSVGVEVLGGATVLPSIGVALLFLGLTGVLLFATLRRRCGDRLAWVAVACLYGNAQVLRTSCDLYADFPLGCLFLAVMVMLLAAEEAEARDRWGLRFVAGVLLGAAVWMKNEGCLFAACLVLASALTLRQRRGTLPWVSVLVPLLVGALPMVGLAFVHRFAVSRANDLVDAWQRGGLWQLFDGDRLAILSRFSWRMLSRWGSGVGIALALVLVGTGGRRGWVSPGGWGRWSAGTLIGVAGGYLGVFLTTPLELDFHLRTAAARLVVQLWPGILLLVFLGLARLETPSIGIKKDA